MRDLNRKKAMLREQNKQCKELVDIKHAENSKLYEIMREIQSNLMELQAHVLDPGLNSGEDILKRCKATSDSLKQLDILDESAALPFIPIYRD